MKKSFILGLIITFIVLIGLATNVSATDIKSLQDKIDNATANETIILEDNYEGDIVIPNGKNITIDLNGKKLTAKTKDTITVELGATLIIKGKGEIINDINGAAIFNNGTTVINDGTIRKSNKQYYNIANHGTMTINGGTVINETEYDGKSHASLVENGYYNYVDKSSRNGYVSGVNQANPSLIINGGTFNGGLNTIKNDEGAKLTINNGKFKNQIQVAVQNWNVATINGGTFETPKGLDKTTIFNGKYNDYSIGELTIKDGIFNADYLLETSHDSTGGTTTILDGKFNTKLGIVNPTYINGNARPTMKLIVKGGTFNQEPQKDYIEKGYISEKTSENKYIVKVNKVSLDVVNTEGNTELEVTEGVQAKIDEILKNETESNEKVKEALENGKKVKIAVVVKDVKEEDISKEEQKVISDFIKEEKIAKYFDISLLIEIDNEVLGKISEPSEKLSFTLTISDDLLKEGREFYIIRNHNGKVEKIETTRNGNKIEFKTDKFSTYALAYEDKEIKADDENKTEESKVEDNKTEEKDTTPKTGALNIAIYTCVALGTIALIGTVKSKNSKH